ncbi:MAG: sulfatase-like hydrolase/transferase [Acidimicrobiia bacterium]
MAADPPFDVVLVIADDQLAPDSVHRAMPFLATRPHGGWTTFRDATAATPLCGPSRATLLTGQFANQHGVVDNDGSLLDDTSTIATWLQTAGYRTGLVGKYINRFPFGKSARARPGWETWRVFTNPGYFAYTITRDATGRRRHPSTYSTDFLTRAAVKFISKVAEDPRPFMLLVGYNAPHSPHTPALIYSGIAIGFTDSPNFNEENVGEKPGYIRGLPALKPGKQTRVRNARQDHYRALRSVDDGIRAIMNELEATERLDRTLFIYTGDNGYSFGAHRWLRKRVPYEESARVPLLMRYPTATADRNVTVPASTVDVVATIADIAGATPGLPLAGESLRPILDGTASGLTRAAALITYRAAGMHVPRYWAVRTEAAKYIEYDDGERELYDLVADPFETANIATEPPSPQQTALAAQLAELKAAAGA